MKALEERAKCADCTAGLVNKVGVANKEEADKDCRVLDQRETPR